MFTRISDELVVGHVPSEMFDAVDRQLCDNVSSDLVKQVEPGSFEIYFRYDQATDEATIEGETIGDSEGLHALYAELAPFNAVMLADAVGPQSISYTVHAGIVLPGRAQRRGLANSRKFHSDTMPWSATAIPGIYSSANVLPTEFEGRILPFCARALDVVRYGSHRHRSAVNKSRKPVRRTFVRAAIVP